MIAADDNAAAGGDVGVGVWWYFDLEERMNGRGGRGGGGGGGGDGGGRGASGVE